MKRKTIAFFLKIFSKKVLKKYQPKIIAVLGSVGKTSTKEAIYCVLKGDFSVLKNEGNLNTEIGVPLTILLGKDAKRNIFLWIFNFLKAIFLIIFPYKNYPKILILEMSEDQPGLLNYLFDLTKPEVAVFSWFSEIPVHIENYPSLEKFQKEFVSFFQKIEPGGLIVLNEDNFLTEKIKEKAKAKILTYGFSQESDFRASNYKLTLFNNEEIEMSFRLEYQSSFLPIKVKNVFSKTQVYPLLSAIAVGQFFGLNLLKMAQKLEDYQIPKGRLHLFKGIKNSLILDDSYNANVDSMINALEVFEELYQLFKEKNKVERKILILGDMLELGEFSEKAHQKIGEKASEIGDYLFAIGEKMAIAGKIFEKIKGKDKVFFFKNYRQALLRIKEFLKEKDFLLIKGSRAINLDLIFSSLKKPS